MTSHAAVVARGMGTCCVAGCGEITVDGDAKKITLPGGQILGEGDEISLDGSTGNVYVGLIESQDDLWIRVHVARIRDRRSRCSDRDIITGIGIEEWIAPKVHCKDAVRIASV